VKFAENRRNCDQNIDPWSFRSSLEASSPSDIADSYIESIFVPQCGNHYISLLLLLVECQLKKWDPQQLSSTWSGRHQGCQTVYFQTEIPNLGKFCILYWKMVNFEGLRLDNIDIFMDIWNILRAVGIFSRHLVYFVAIWYILPVKSGNPGRRKSLASAPSNLLDS
jgi:hypothetical protein